MERLSRRNFMGRLGSIALIPGLAGLPAHGARTANGEGIGLALGSGGANGLAHIIVLETLEELGVRPARIAGSSIGALIGAFAAAGHDSRDLRGLVKEFAPPDFASWAGALFNRNRSTFLDFFELDMERGSLVDREAFERFLAEHLAAEDFESLSIPLTVTATDFWAREPVTFESGPLIPPVLASIALPGVFAPIRIGDRLLVDGGMVNPVPWDLIQDSVSFTVAVDVVGQRTPPANGDPGYLDTIFNSFQIMQNSIIRTKRRISEPDLYLRPPITGIRVLDFHKAESVYRQAEPVKDELKRALEPFLSAT